MLTDSEIDQFLASMPSATCRKFVQRSINDLPCLFVGLILGFPGLCAIPVSGWVGEMFALPFVAALYALL